jgi:hypothetical protein
MEGYPKIAGVMAGMYAKDETVIGAKFCANVDRDLVGTVTVTPTLGINTCKVLAYTQALTPYGECQVKTYFRNHGTQSHGTGLGGLTNLSKAVLVRTRPLPLYYYP